jgi:hypothetical protein
MHNTRTREIKQNSLLSIILLLQKKTSKRCFVYKPKTRLAFDKHVKTSPDYACLKHLSTKQATNRSSSNPALVTLTFKTRLFILLLGEAQPAPLAEMPKFTEKHHPLSPALSVTH